MAGAGLNLMLAHLQHRVCDPRQETCLDNPFAPVMVALVD